MVEDPPSSEGCHEPGAAPGGSHLSASILVYRNNAGLLMRKLRSRITGGMSAVDLGPSDLSQDW